MANINLTFRWINNPRWYTVDSTVEEYVAALNSGLLEGRALSALRLWQHEYTDATDFLIFDFELVKTGRPGFRSETQMETA